MRFPQLETWLTSFGFGSDQPAETDSPITFDADRLRVRIGGSSAHPIHIFLLESEESGDPHETLYEGANPDEALALLRDLIYGKRILAKRIPLVDERPDADKQEITLTVSDARELQDQLEALGVARIRFDTAYQAWHGHSGESGILKGEETLRPSEVDQKRFLEIYSWTDRGGRERWDRSMIAIVE